MIFCSFLLVNYPQTKANGITSLIFSKIFNSSI
nr:MAG TPA: hypothetical protein [Caudoviricetes sp.]